MTSKPFAAITAAIGAPSLPRPTIEMRGSGTVELIMISQSRRTNGDPRG